MMAPPIWVEVRAVQEAGATAFPVTLHRGEREAILLAESLPADVLLIDEQIGRTIALGRNLAVSGTLGILERADKMGLLKDFPRVLQELKRSGFFVGSVLEQKLLERHRIRQKAR